MKVTTNTTTQAGALAAIILCFCENVKLVATNIHTVTLHGKKRKHQIRSNDNKNHVFITSDETFLIKTMSNFVKRTLKKDRFETTKEIVLGVNNLFSEQEKQKNILEKIIYFVKKSNPKPWRVGADGDCLIDSKNKVFLTLPSGPEAGLSSQHLQYLVTFGEPVENVAA